MLFRRPSVRYGRTPEPETPYQKAAQRRRAWAWPSLSTSTTQGVTVPRAACQIRPPARPAARNRLPKAGPGERMLAHRGGEHA